MQPEPVTSVAYDLSVVEDHYVITPEVIVTTEQRLAMVRQSHILYVIELRTSVDEIMLKNIKKTLVSSCAEYLLRGLDCISFIINGVHHQLKNHDAVEDFLDGFLKTIQEENYVQSLIKLRHAISNIQNKLKNKQISLIFFLSSIHTTIQKESYVDYLNSHSEACAVQIDRISNLVRRISVKGNVHIVGCSKLIEGEDESTSVMSMVDNDLINSLYRCFNRVKYFCSIYYGDSSTKVNKLFNSVCESICLDGCEILLKVPLLRRKIAVPQSEDDSNDEGPVSYLTLKLKPSQSNSDLFTIETPKFMKKQSIDLSLINLSCIGVDALPAQIRQVQLSKQAHLGYVMIWMRVALYNISSRLLIQIISTKRVYLYNGKFKIETSINHQLQAALTQQINVLEERLKDIHTTITSKAQGFKNADRSKLYGEYQATKYVLDTLHSQMTNLIKKEITNNSIRVISQAINHHSVKRTIRNKLLRRINANPRRLEKVYDEVEAICNKGDPIYVDLEVQQQEVRQMAGNCVISDCNFVKALQNRDCLAMMFELQRPQSAIMDPGRIRIRTISPFLARVSKFFEVYCYQITEGQFQQGHQGGEWVREYAEVYKEDYQERWDYWCRVEKRTTAIGVLPLYLTDEHWQVGKLLMKPCLGWTCCEEPLGYTYAQTQVVPFVVLENLNRKIQELSYQVSQLEDEVKEIKKQQNLYPLERKRKSIKMEIQRFSQLQTLLLRTCIVILKEMSVGEQPFIPEILNKFQAYKEPINRTVDIISNNSCFLAQLYCLWEMKEFKLETQSFHDFFKRMLEEELRRETDGWNEEDEQDAFINKLLNSEVENMEKPVYEVCSSSYYDAFQTAREGGVVRRKYYEIERDRLEMHLKKEGHFNETQCMVLIEYKRLYENRVLHLWYTRFLMERIWERRAIHKWRCMDLTNPYQLFTMIIQNKIQRKNAKRREAVLNGEYIDPFEYWGSKEYLEGEFMRVRAKKEAGHIRVINAKKYDKAADVFAYSKHLEECAGVMINCDSGKQLPVLFEALKNGKAILLQEKLKMMLLGEFEGVLLFRGWKMSKKRMNLLRQSYPMEFRRYQYMM